jgi:hypothetical protein
MWFRDMGCYNSLAIHHDAGYHLEVRHHHVMGGVEFYVLLLLRGEGIGPF